jgi:hypothetical protein
MKHECEWLKVFMFRFLYTLCDLLAAVSAIISPVAIFHWLGKIVNVPAVKSMLTPLNPVFDPMNTMVELFIKTPPITYEGHSYSTTQGVLACILTAAFFLFNFLSETLKATEQRLDVSRQSLQQKQRLQKIRDEHLSQQKKVLTNYRTYVYVSYDTQACPTGAGYLEAAFSKNGGKMLEAYVNTLSLEFDSISSALKYCLDVSQAMMSYYATLRPIDPQPPFQIGLNAVSSERPTQDGIAEARKLVRYAGPNQVIFSQDIRTLMEANSLSMDYRYQSIGIYSFGGTEQQELFRLFFTKPSSSSL